MIEFKAVQPRLFEPRKESEIWNRSLLLEAGKAYRFKAPSGSGKSSLVQFIAGLKKDFEGEILVNGENMARVNSGRRAEIFKRSLSILFQDIRLITSLSILENLNLKSELTSFSREDLIAICLRLGLDIDNDPLIEVLSQGERQRVAIARALLQPFDWLVLDEPFAHLDSRNAQIAQALIKEKVVKNQAGLIVMSLDAGEGFSVEKEFQL